LTTGRNNAASDHLLTTRTPAKIFLDKPSIRMLLEPELIISAACSLRRLQIRAWLTAALVVPVADGHGE
jgi:hypothetical protein